MQITSLPATGTLGANDVLACEINGVTYKITGYVLASMLQTLGGTLAVSKGGTGLTASPSLQVNLASDSATNILQASPRPGVTGVLTLAHGGLGKDFSAAVNAVGFHNSIFRGKNLGTSLTSAQSTAIQNGTFDDLFVGDYWVINGVTWRIADFDTYYRCGNPELTTHHIVVVPDTRLYLAPWNSNDSISAGYVGSTIRANIKSTVSSNSGAEGMFISAFGSSHVLSYRGIYPTTYSNGQATGWAYTDARVELMNEVELLGTNVWAATPKFETGIGKRQFSLFRLAPNLLNTHQPYWLRSISSAGKACLFTDDGVPAGQDNLTQARGVRPFALIA